MCLCLDIYVFAYGSVRIILVRHSDTPSATPKCSPSVIIPIASSFTGAEGKYKSAGQSWAEQDVARSNISLHIYSHTAQTFDFECTSIAQLFYLLSSRLHILIYH